MTTIVSVRRNGQVALAGDGQVSLGNTVMKGNAGPCTGPIVVIEELQTVRHRRNDDGREFCVNIDGECLLMPS